jgi:uncharacterized membrane protein YtjA (UPF0391 family)
MSYILSSLSDFDLLCGQFAIALQHAEWRLYATLALILVLSALLFPPRNDPDQVWSPCPPERCARCGVYCSELICGANNMLGLVVTLLIIALIAAILGFGGIAGAAVGIAKIVFFVALVLFLISLIAGGVRGGFGRRL